jgi:hypothetical protein
LELRIGDFKQRRGKEGHSGYPPVDCGVGMNVWIVRYSLNIFNVYLHGESPKSNEPDFFRKTLPL